ncbi:MAG: type I 3-dehydroquinate dehydratase [Candidatus Peregrinibacteria bacterium]|nr:type I 3-dehydroquinate dehydratase [Candidatus Peregrinibacteria bacterium]
MTKRRGNGFNRAMICVPIRQNSSKKATKIMVSAQKVADISEIWFDEISNFSAKDMEEIMKNKKNPIIYKWQGNRDNLAIVLGKKIEYIDVDIKTEQSIIREIRKISPKTKIIISFHDFKKTPKDADLREIIAKMKTKNADIFKLATFANDFSDNLRVLKILSDLTEKGEKAICICMGEKGKFSRTAGHLLGNYLMYAPLNKKDITAEGQLTVKELKKCL